MRRLLALLLVASAAQADELGERADAAFVASFSAADAALFVRAAAQDEVQRLCSDHRNAPPQQVAEAIERFQRAAIRYPPSLIGDWREGERNGADCRACHQIEAHEPAFGRVGPSLLGYGKTRGWGVAAQRVAYERIYNAQAFTACSAMPRFGHNSVLAPEQIAHLVALLLDPTSPVNR